MNASSSSAKSKPGFHVGQQVQQCVAQAVRGWASPPANCRKAMFNSLASPASITPNTASAWVKSIRPARNARNVNSPGPASRAPAAQSERKTSCNNGGEPSV